MQRRKSRLFIITLILMPLLVFGVWWIDFLRVAHSSFENYYTFRGCVSLIQKTDTEAVCELKNGTKIKMVAYDNRWFLAGDLPLDAILSATTSDTTIIPCKDELGGTPVITSSSASEGPVGTTLDLVGCNFSGFEGDKDVWVENSEGTKGIIYGERSSTSKLLRIVMREKLCQKDTSYSGMQCDAYLTLVPGTYKLYTLPFGKKSNVVTFTIR